MVYDWIKRFKEDKEQLEGDPWERRPSPSKIQENIKLVQNLVKEDHWITFDGVANEVGIPQGSAFAILREDLGLIKLSVKLYTLFCDG